MNHLRRYLPILGLSVLLVGAFVAPASAAKTFGQRFDSQVSMKLAKPGLINDPGNPLHWTKLKGVPAVFADGADNGLTDVNDCPEGNAIRVIHGDATVECVAISTGDVTGITAGEGLTGGGTSGDIELDADFTEVQDRVAGTCAAGNSIREIKQDGTVTCESDDTAGLIASGVVAANGSIFGVGTNNWTSTYFTSAGPDDHYEITVTGVTYSISSYMTVITPLCINTPVVFANENFSGKSAVYFKLRSDGTETQCNFAFQIFDI